MIYIIDHQDSFTWNVVHQFSEFDNVICNNYFEINYENHSEISAASGVVLDSAPKKEFNENYIKAKSLLELFK